MSNKADDDLEDSSSISTNVPDSADFAGDGSFDGPNPGCCLFLTIAIIYFLFFN